MTTFCDFFCGCGGFSTGLIKSGLTHEFGVDSCIDSIDIQKTYEHNVGHFIKEDIAKFDGTPYRGKIDVVVGSPPCKSFSVANIKTRTMDTTLIKHFMRIVGEIQPKVWLWENVNGVQHRLTKQKALVDKANLYCYGSWLYERGEFRLKDVRRWRNEASYD